LLQEFGDGEAFDVALAVFGDGTNLIIPVHLVTLIRVLGHDDGGVTLSFEASRELITILANELSL